MYDITGQRYNQSIDYLAKNIYLCISWSTPNELGSFAKSGESTYGESGDMPGPRYGHTATVIEMHPPKIMVRIIKHTCKITYLINWYNLFLYVY